MVEREVVCMVWWWWWWWLWGGGGGVFVLHVYGMCVVCVVFGVCSVLMYAVHVCACVIM